MKKSETKKSFGRAKFALVLLMIAFISIPVTFATNGASDLSGVTVVDMGLPEESSDALSKETVALYIQMTSFDAEKRRAELAVFPWPTDELATQFSSSVIGEVPIKIFVDGHENGTRTFVAAEQLGAVNVTADVLSTRDPSRSSDALYPFDSYELDSYAQVQANLNGRGFESIQTFDYFYTTPVPGFDITYERASAFEETIGSSPYELDVSKLAAERAEGKISFFAKIERSIAVKSIAVFIYLFALLTAISTAAVTIRMVYGGRLVSMEALTWQAAAILGVIQLRSVAPGNPRIGVLADMYLFFPSLLIMLTCGIVMTVLWIRRSDSLS